MPNLHSSPACWVVYDSELGIDPSVLRSSGNSVIGIGAREPSIGGKVEQVHGKIDDDFGIGSKYWDECKYSSFKAGIRVSITLVRGDLCSQELVGPGNAPSCFPGDDE